MTDLYAVSERSKLYAIEPIGKETALVECISSYICRVANSHNVTVSSLLNDLIYPRLSVYPSIKNIKGKILQGSINGITKTALDLVRVLELLTKREDLLELTLLNWSNVLNSKLNYSKKRWCTKCFYNWRQEKKILYEPLIWHISELEVCAEHLLPLQDKCLNCDKNIPYLTALMQIGYCPYCNQFLGETTVIERVLSGRELNLINAYSTMLQENGSLTSVPTKRAIMHFFLQIIKETPDISYVETSKNLDFTKNRIASWFSGRAAPPTQFWAEVSHIINVPFNQLFSGCLDFSNLKPLMQKKKKQPFRIIIDENEKERVRKLVSDYLRNANEYLTIAELAKKYMFSERILREYLPELKKEVVKKLKDYKEEEKEKRLKKIELDIQKYLRRNGNEYPSLNKVLKTFEISYEMARKYFPDLCSSICCNRKLYLYEKKKQSTHRYENELKDIIYGSHEQGFFPSDSLVHKKFSKPIILSNLHYREYIIKVRKQLGYPE